MKQLSGAKLQVRLLKHQTRLERLAWDKHSSLLRKLVTYGRKKCYNICSLCQSFKLYFFVIVTLTIKAIVFAFGQNFKDRSQLVQYFILVCHCRVDQTENTLLLQQVLLHYSKKLLFIQMLDQDENTYQDKLYLKGYSFTLVCYCSSYKCYTRMKIFTKDTRYLNERNRHYVIQHNDTQHNNIQNNDTKNKRPCK